MYYGLMPDSAAFTVAAGTGGAFYPAPVPLRDRKGAGFRFELAAGQAWQWTGPGGPELASLTDVLAAANTARLTNLPGYQDADLAAVHAAHQRAAQDALAGGDTGLAVRLVAEQAEVAAAALIGEEEAARRLGITGRSLNNLRLAYRSICPPVLIAGSRRTKWFWAPAQFAAWQAARPGRGWRLGRSGPGSGDDAAEVIRPGDAPGQGYRPGRGTRRITGGPGTACSQVGPAQAPETRVLGRSGSGVPGVRPGPATGAVSPRPSASGRLVRADIRRYGDDQDKADLRAAGEELKARRSRKGIHRRRRSRQDAGQETPGAAGGVRP